MSANEGAAAEEAVRPRWSVAPDWYLWDGGFMALGQVRGIVPPHQHHAIQIVVAIDGTVGMRGEAGDWQMASGVIVRPDVVHSYNGNGATGALILIDPESSEGVWLKTSLRDDITVVPQARLAACIGELRTFLERPLEALEVAALVRHCVQAMCAGAPPSRRLDKRVTRVLAAIREADDLRISIDTAAAMAFLSPSRFAHLFKQQVGLPFRHYMLWRKLARAMLVIGREGTISAAAHEAGFADAAHLTRTFYQMFGLAPSVMMRGAFFEIPSPFDLPAPAPLRR
ncbi:MAG: helix-turn-helix domain-containing protein [Devosia sp.]